ncbi:zinc transporter ZIP13 homolog isoform X2 [Prorops nasuta]|uniref:zinc transporter ZIP13 homolog isoform X2 n=1 Tax=Prorops nasuta TaxID=863751 RepID=UPI0034CE3D48
MRTFFKDKTKSNGAGTLRILLSFAVGGLLGDVFLHLLPEAWGNNAWKDANGHPSMACGLWVLTGFLVFIIIEKFFAFENESEPEKEDRNDACERTRETFGQKEIENNNCLNINRDNVRNGVKKNGFVYSKNLSEIPPFLEKIQLKNSYDRLANEDGKVCRNGFEKQSQESFFTNGLSRVDLTDEQIKDCLKRLNGFSTNGCKLKGEDIYSKAPAKEKPKHITGYLNLMANCIDNFTHGLAVGGSFLVSFRLGALTTFAILVHEIPHEVGDFAILLRSGFSRWDAARAQLLTASGGIFGALAAVLFSSGGVEAKTSWILPFTAGGFLHIGLVTILPELQKESNPKESLKQLGSLIFGVILMAVLTILCD